MIQSYAHKASCILLFGVSAKGKKKNTSATFASRASESERAVSLCIAC